MMKRIIDPVAAVIIVLLVGSVEGYLYPVTRSWTAREIVIEREPTGEAKAAVIKGYMHKVRNCKFVGIEAIDQGTNYQLPIEFMDVANDNQTRPVGSQSWGPWKVHISSSTPSVEVRMVHDCHPVWTTKTVLGEFEIPARTVP